MGSFVDQNPGYHGGYTSTEDEIEEVFDYMRTKADRSETDLSNALTELSGLYPNFSFSGQTPAAPGAAPVSSFNWQADNISTEMYLALFNQVTTDMSSGGTGLSDAVHTAIVARELYGRRLSEERTYQGALDNVGTDGFSLASGQIAYMEAEFARDIEEKNNAVLNDLLARDFELAQKNKESAIASGLQLEGMIRDLFSKLQGFSLDAAKAAQAYVFQTFDASLRQFDSAWKEIEIELHAHGLDASLAEKIADARASVAVQSLASALGGINASMSLGHSSSVSDGKSRTWTVGNSLTETHPYKET